MGGVTAEYEQCIHNLGPGCVWCNPAAVAREPALDRLDHDSWRTGAAAGMATEEAWSCAGDGCDYEIIPSDMIRPDGEGGWHCWVCGNEEKEGV